MCPPGAHKEYEALQIYRLHVDPQYCATAVAMAR
jgi:hypothetical protein